MASWEVVLSKGQEWDWFGDPFHRVQTLAGLFCVHRLDWILIVLIRGTAGLKEPDH